MAWRRSAALLLTVFLAFASAAKAQDASDQKIGIPIYDPVSKRYFAMMHSAPHRWQWAEVNQQARSLWYKGVRGRLAIVNSFEVHDFLLRTFHPKYYQYEWFGLKYLCHYHKLIWSDGKPFKRNGFAAWDKKWKQDIYFCASPGDPNDWAPIAYSPSFTWIAKGKSKGYPYYFMEYPTGHP